jgi:hypothetical protein
LFACLKAILRLLIICASIVVFRCALCTRRRMNEQAAQSWLPCAAFPCINGAAASVRRLIVLQTYAACSIVGMMVADALCVHSWSAVCRAAQSAANQSLCSSALTLTMHMPSSLALSFVCPLRVPSPPVHRMAPSTPIHTGMMRQQLATAAVAK